MDAESILICRNRNRKQHIMYVYEAVEFHLKNVGDFLSKKFGGRSSISDANNIIVCWFFWKLGKVMPYLKEKELLKIKELDKYISSKM